MCEKPGCECHTFSMDSKTPLNLYLSGYFKRLEWHLFLNCHYFICGIQLVHKILD